MIIAIASGKGGTGKTTVAVNLALTLKDKMPITLLDCDVEEPNAHLFLMPEFTEKESVTLPVPSIDSDKCTHCGICTKICAYHALADLGKRILVFEELCHGCGGCSLLCPEKAITEIHREIGIVEQGTAEGIEFVQGTLTIGSVLAPTVIKRVKSKIKSGLVVIIDSPPGTSCPMVNAVAGADYCVLVTEPTPFGLSDLKLAVEVVRELKIPFGVVINRAGIGNDEVEQYLKEEGISLLLKIPFDRRYAFCYADGHLLIEKFPELRQSFMNLWKAIERRVKA
ncbi:MAG: ATP-binding protein [Thermovenabulum sp.]|uniref:ATP-binding protein n=1 Tax=Thermovenabulum sp. TaxID=3100335 RepID=UPI003C7AE09D